MKNLIFIFLVVLISCKPKSTVPAVSGKPSPVISDDVYVVYNGHKYYLTEMGEMRIQTQADTSQQNSYAYWSIANTNDLEIGVKSGTGSLGGSQLFMDYNNWQGGSTFDLNCYFDPVGYSKIYGKPDFMIIDQSTGNLQIRHLGNLQTQNRIIGQSVDGRIGYLTIGNGLQIVNGVLSVKP